MKLTQYCAWAIFATLVTTKSGIASDIPDTGGELHSTISSQSFGSEMGSPTPIPLSAVASESNMGAEASSSQSDESNAEALIKNEQTIEALLEDSDEAEKKEFIQGNSKYYALAILGFVAAPLVYFLAKK